MNLKNIYHHSQFKDDDYNLIMSKHSLSDCKKNLNIFQAGEIQTSYFCVESGLFRSYVIDYNGNQITTGFWQAGEIIIDEASLFLGIQSKENFQALTNCSYWEIHLEDFQELFYSIEHFADWGKNWMSQRLFEHKIRSIDMITISAKERYLKLLETKPEVIKNAPLKYIASYLGITDSSLSRIRADL